MFAPVLIWNVQHDWASFRFQFVRAVATHELSLRTVGEFLGLQFGLVGFVLLPVVLSGVTLTAWRGYRTPRAGRDPAVDRRDRAVRLFLLEIADAAGRRYLADVPLAGRICRHRHQPRDAAARGLAGLDDPDRRSHGPGWRSISGIAFVVGVFFYYVAAPWNLIGRTDPVGGEAGYEQVVARARAQLQKTGATWIATTDYRTYAMMRWYFNGRVPGDPDQRARPVQGFRDPGMDLIRDHTGLYVAREPDDRSPVWDLTTAKREPLERVERSLAREW